MNTDEQKIYVQIGELKAGVEQLKRERDGLQNALAHVGAERDAVHAGNVKLEAQRDELLAALRDLSERAHVYRWGYEGDKLLATALDRARLAIARATTGEKP